MASSDVPNSAILSDQSSATDQVIGSDVTPQAFTPTTFHPFKKMAQELQVMVWDHATYNEDKRKIRIYSEPRANSESEGPGMRRASYTIPGILQTCKGSRVIALGRWTLKYGTRLQDSRGVYLGDGDKLYFQDPNALLGFFGATYNQSLSVMQRLLPVWPLDAHLPTLILGFEFFDMHAGDIVDWLFDMGYPGEIVMLMDRDDNGLSLAYRDHHNAFMQVKLSYIWFINGARADALSYMCPRIREVTSAEYEVEMNGAIAAE